MTRRRLPLILGFALAPLVCGASAHADPGGVAVIIGKPPFQGSPNAGDRFRDCAECPEMVVVPSGSSWRFMAAHLLSGAYICHLVHDSNLTCSKLWYGPALGLFVIAQDCI